MKRESTPEFSRIPSVDSVLRRPDMQPLMEAHGRAVVTEAVREILARMRNRLSARETVDCEAPGFLRELDGLIDEAVRRRTDSTLRRVINATGVVIHTNLGRAVLSREAQRRVGLVAASYATLEYDLEQGRRGSRSSHLERRLSFLFPDQGALAVNNNAAAVFLALNTLADGRQVVISRGELVEIGDSFRIPDVMAKSGAKLREVGTTNRTHLADYEKAIDDQTALILKVHTSNYRIVGFTQEVSVADLSGLARRRGLLLMVDQGSGCLQELGPAGVRGEPTVRGILDEGADLVTFSGDKILGGPQAGIALGRRELIERMRRSPLYRVLRLDKMSIAALEATLDAYVRGSERADLPVQRMIFSSRDEIAGRAMRLSAALAARLGDACEVDVEDGVSRVGGGAAPAEELPTVLVRLRPRPGAGRSVSAWEAALRSGQPPVVARIRDDALLLDLRTVDPAEESELIEAVTAPI